MPLYFFDLLSAEGLAPDEEGTELSSLDEIQNEAAYALADMLRDEVRATNGNPRAGDLMIVVRDKNGPVLEAKYSFQIARVQ
ncbi:MULTISPECIES: DUF6894 family protein [Bradyrhizobium]|jgi:hypothetical protein|uniref:DUF6894 family protein n=1 Tax=Bradyrhizobium TaxID=374 RepID=UPI00209C73FC|nr:MULTISPECIES: hypothetical protein [Bradyrhizobium]MCP1966778.1 hypothetical protein [Bradyrhizobium elkanii]MCS3522943.1 hypothetical protein [Bradyrhizobium elkanii]MCS4070596.1 hypothetical protein [Bradyrhizobium elkanii]MCS4077228.1 hypothetical protein [Bradyrhizobium elkanii]MCS4111718.1 hypothetical protein [Bradyrhizobium elkanii]